MFPTCGLFHIDLSVMHGNNSPFLYKYPSTTWQTVQINNLCKVWGSESFSAALIGNSLPVAATHWLSSFSHKEGVRITLGPGGGLGSCEGGMVVF